MTERFTVSNGWYVEDGFFYNDQDQIAQGAGNPGILTAIEYGRHLERTERDAELNRWRSKKHPDYVVYPSTPVRVLEESTGSLYYYTVAMLQAATGAPGEVAREYFDAQKSAKPWLNAKPGEVWLLTLDGKGEVPMTVAKENDYVLRFWAGGNVWSPGDSGITAGRRIWPEPEEES